MASPTFIGPTAARRIARAVRSIEGLGVSPRERRGRSAPRPGLGLWLGKVVTAGPDSEADYANNRYWIRRLKVTNTTATAATGGTLTDLVTTDYITDEDDPDYRWVTVTNLAETELATHLLQEGQIVVVHWDHDAGHTVSGNLQREVRYWTRTTPGIRPTLKITGHSTIGGHPYQWLYSGIEQTLSMPSGVPTVANKSGAPTWTDLVINRPEIGNPTSAGVVLSTGGVDTTGADFPAGADVLPLPTGLILPFERIVIDGDAYYLVDFPNGIDGTCE